MREASRQRSAFYKHVWDEAATRMNGEIENLFGDIQQISLEDFRTKVCCNYTAIDDPVTLSLVGNKAATYRLLARKGLPIPRHTVFSLEHLQRARAFLRQVEGACVVKPAKDTGAGQGVFTGVISERQLARAAAVAAVYDRELILEEQITGANYRLLFLNGTLLDTVLRRPPAVMGNGRSSIRELILQSNSERLAGGFRIAQVQLTIDDEMRRTLARQGLSLRSIPRLAQKVVVKTVINENSAAENEAVGHSICPSIISDAARAAECLGAQLAGVDVITEDISRPLCETGGVILEVNTTPGFYYHYHRQGGPCPVALYVLQYLYGVYRTLRRKGVSLAPTYLYDSPIPPKSHP